MKRRELFDNCSDEKGLNVDKATQYVARAFNCHHESQLKKIKDHVSVVSFNDLQFS